MPSIYDSYGIPPDKGEAMMKIIEYVAIENPKLALEASYVHTDLVGLVDHFDIMWTTSMQKSYAKRRKWDVMMAIREFIQNSLDAEHEKLGYDNIDIEIHHFKGKSGLVIRDRGDGVTYKSFELGGEDKKCYLRGAYGEGMKVAALYMSMNRNDVYIFSGDTVYKCYISKLTDMLTISIGKSTDYISGTKVIIINLNISQDEIDKIIYQPYDPTIEKKYTSYYYGTLCFDDMPNTVMHTPGERHRLYVRDMFVNYLDEIVDGVPFYSYNLWWIDLEPNRTNVSRSSQLNVEVSKLLSKADPFFIEHLIESNLDHITRDHQHYRIDDDIWELNVCRFESSDELTYMITNLLSKYSIGAYTTSSDIQDIKIANHEGITPIIIPYNLRSLFDNVPSVTDILIKANKKIAEADQIHPYQLTISELSTLNEWTCFTEYAIDNIRYIDKCAIYGCKDRVGLIVNSGDRSFYEHATKTISMSIDTIRDKKYTAFIHELSHAVDCAINYSTADVTENFESALAITGSVLLKSMRDQEYQAFKSRCDCLCFNATPSMTGSFFPAGITGPSGIRYADVYDIYMVPSCIMVVINKSVYPVVNISEVLSSRGYLSPEDAQEIYDTTTNNALDILLNAICRVADIHDSIPEFTKYDIISDIIKCFNLPENQIDDREIYKLLDSIARLKEKDEINVYKYDLKKDRYDHIQGW
jgi:hypothetical protein